MNPDSNKQTGKRRFGEKESCDYGLGILDDIKESLLMFLGD